MPGTQPGAVNLAGEQTQVVADADPARFPAGLEVTITAPGKLELLARVTLPAGQMLAILPAGMSNALRFQLAQAIAEAARRKGAPPA